MEANLAHAIQECKDLSPSKVWIGFVYLNDDGVRIKRNMTRLSMLYKDWYSECEYCPSNDTKIIAVKMRTDVTRRKFEVTDADLEFGDFMDELEKNWSFQRTKGPQDETL